MKKIEQEVMSKPDGGDEIEKPSKILLISPTVHRAIRRIKMVKDNGTYVYRECFPE
jgi:hypothetical protein